MPDNHDPILALDCLRLAHENHESLEAVVQRAEAYLAFCTGRTKLPEPPEE